MMTSRCSRERVERGAQVAEGLACAAVVRRLRRADLLDRHGAAAPHVVDGGVVRDAQYPGGERHAARLVARQRAEQLGEHLLGDVLGLVLVAHDRADVAVDVVRVAQVEEAQRVLVALLGLLDRAQHEPLGSRGLVELPPAAEAAPPDRELDQIGLASDRPVGARVVEHPASFGS